MDEREESAPLPEPVAPPADLSIAERYGISPILLGFLSLVVVFIAYQVIGGVITYFLFGMKPTDANVAGFRIATGAGQLLFIFLPTLFLVRIATTSPKEFLRVRMPDVRTLILPLVGVFSLQQMLQVYMTFQDKIPLPGPLQDISREFKDMFEEAYKLLATANSIPELLVVILVIALIPALAEEFLFRGMVQRCFEKGFGSMRGVILTGVIFAAYHLNPFSFIPLVVLGIYLGFLAMRANSIWASAAAHFYNNAFACVATYLKVDDNALVVGNSDTLSPGMLLGTFWFFGVVFLISTFYFMRITQPQTQSQELE